MTVSDHIFRFILRPSWQIDPRESPAHTNKRRKKERKDVLSLRPHLTLSIQLTQFRQTKHIQQSTARCQKSILISTLPIKSMIFRSIYCKFGWMNSIACSFFYYFLAKLNLLRSIFSRGILIVIVVPSLPSSSIRSMESLSKSLICFNRKPT